jgi:hypothetical protein
MGQSLLSHFPSRANPQGQKHSSSRHQVLSLLSKLISVETMSSALPSQAKYTYSQHQKHLFSPVLDRMNRHGFRSGHQIQMFPIPLLPSQIKSPISLLETITSFFSLNREKSSPQQRRRTETILANSASKHHQTHLC